MILRCAATNASLVFSEDEDRIPKLIVQRQWVGSVVAEVKHVYELQLGNALQQASELVSPIDPQAMFGLKSADATGLSRFQGKTKKFLAFAAGEFQHTDGGCEPQLAAVHCPAFAIELFSIGWQQMEAEHIKTAGFKMCCDALQMLASICLGKQVSEGIDEAVRELERAWKAEIPHVLLTNVGGQS